MTDDHVALIDDLARGNVMLVTHAGTRIEVSRQSSWKLRALLGV